MFKYFGESTLKELIGQDLLSKVEEVLPYLDKDLDQNALHRKKVLSKILASFTDASTFKKKSFLRDLYHRIPEDLLDQLIKELNPELIDSSFKEKANYLINLGWKTNNTTRKIINILNLSDSFIPASEEKKPSIETVGQVNKPYKILKKFQSQVYFDSLKFVSPFTRFIIQMPTGSGKTRTAMEIICNQFIDNDKIIIIWIAHSTELCEQAIQGFKEIWEHVGNKDVQIARVYGDHNPLKSIKNKSTFVFGGFQKMYSLYSNNENIFDSFLDDVSLIIVDEAHKVLAPTYKKLTNKLTYSNGCLIGLTATPGRSKDDLFQNEKLAEYFFNKKISIIPENSDSVIKYLKKINVLSYAEFESLTTSVEIELNEKQLKYLEDKFDFPPGFLKKLGQNQIRNLEILEKLMDYLNEEKQTLFFATSVEQSKFVNSVLTYFNFKSCHIDGSTNKGTREKNIEKFKNEEIQIICNFGVLTTGFDAPKTDLVFIARPTSSIVLYSQMIGRGLRGPAIGGTEKCTICTVKDNIANLPKEHQIYEYFDEYFE